MDMPLVPASVLWLLHSSGKNMALALRGVPSKLRPVIVYTKGVAVAAPAWSPNTPQTPLVLAEAATNAFKPCLSGFTEALLALMLAVAGGGRCRAAMSDLGEGCSWVEPLGALDLPACSGLGGGF